MFKKDMQFTVKIAGLTAEGEGIGTVDGFKLFIPGALSGEEVLVKITELKKRYGRAKLLKILLSSPLRQAPPCPVYGTCGGCQLQHLSYVGQLTAKTERVLQAFRRIAHIEDVNVEPCIASPTPFSYRNKIQLPTMTGPNGMCIGLYKQNSHEVIPIEGCLIHTALGEEVFRLVKDLINRSEITAYNESTGEGELRHCMIKSAMHTGEVLVTLVTNGPGSAHLNRLAQTIFDSSSSVKGVVQNINSYRSNTILGREYRTLAGEPFIEEIICGLTFKVSSASFFQVNPAQAENLYNYAIEAAGIQGDERIVDAYCGVGTLSLLLAQKAKNVIGIECVPEAIEDARINANRNSIHNVTFRCDYMENAPSLFKNSDIVFLNPPRKGCERAVIDALCEMKPKKIIYISCDPATLARDVAILYNGGNGYSISAIQPFDMFPQTAHVETVVSLTL